MKTSQQDPKGTIRYIAPDGYFECVKSPDFYFKNKEFDFDGRAQKDLYVKTVDGTFEKRIFAGIFTGFYDENGQEIYTGDVVQFNETCCGVSENNNKFYLIGGGFDLSLSQAKKEAKKLYITGNLFYDLHPRFLEESIEGLCRHYTNRNILGADNTDELIKSKSPKFRQPQLSQKTDHISDFNQLLRENPWQHVADLAKKSGHYYDSSQTYATQDDLPILEKYNEKAHPKHKFILDVLPCPFEGDIFNAKIIVLTLNPGFIEHLNHGLYSELNSNAQKRVTDHHIQNLELVSQSIPTDEIVATLAENYWNDKTQELRAEYDFTHQDFAIVQYIGYQSEEFNERQELKQLKSIEFTKLLIEYIIKNRTDDYAFVIARKKDFWEPLLRTFFSEEQFKKHVIELKTYRNTVLTKNNIVNFEIIERIALQLDEETADFLCYFT
jgi:hypothetical protein